MNKAPIIFLDTNILKASVDQLPIFEKVKQSVNWGGMHFEADVCRLVIINPNIKFLRNGNKDRFIDTILLPYFARFAQKGYIRLICHDEVRFELWKLPRANDRRGRFYGAPIQFIKGPITYGRIIAGGPWGVDHQYEFLKTIKDTRFKELQKACGAYMGLNKDPNKNQIIDAFHLWFAEHAKADYFMTLDGKLIKVLSKNKKYKLKVEVFTPQILLIDLLRKRKRLVFQFIKITILMLWEKHRNRTRQKIFKT